MRSMMRTKRQEVSEHAIDVLDNEGRVTVFRDELIAGGEVHGSGCTLSAAIAACLGRGQNLEEAIQAAKSFVTEAIRRSPALGTRSAASIQRHSGT